MKLSPPLAATLLLFALSSVLRAQTGSVNGGSAIGIQPNGNSPYPDRTGSSSTGDTATDKNIDTKSDPTYQEKATDESDDALYHGRTNETDNPMMRDEGPLHFKTHPKEKAHEVSSVKELKTSAADKAFAGNLLHSSVTSIEDVVPSKLEAPRNKPDDSNARFKPKQLEFVPEKDDKPGKTEDSSSPSPTPSPTASAQAKSSSDQN